MRRPSRDGRGGACVGARRWRMAAQRGKADWRKAGGARAAFPAVTAPGPGEAPTKCGRVCIACQSAIEPTKARKELLPRSDCQTPGRAREGQSPLALQSNPAACTPDPQQFLRRGACPRRRNCFLAVSAPGNAQHFSGNWRGWQWRGSLLPRHIVIFQTCSGRGRSRPCP